jgi:hypothetical protein
MSNSNSQVRIIAATVFVFALLIGLVFYLKDNFDKFIATATDVHLGAPGVRSGQGFVNSSVLVQDDRLGNVMDVTSDRQNPSLVWVAGKKCMMSVQTDGKIMSAVKLPIAPYHFRWVDLNNKTTLMNTGSWVSPASLFDSNGNVKWSYSPEGGINDTTACYNILGDNKTEFIVGFNGDAGIHLLDAQGHLVWKVSESNVWHIEAQDLNDDGKVKIVHSNAEGKLVVRNSDGSIQVTFNPPVYVKDFTLTDWINENGPTAIVFPNETKYTFWSISKSAPVTEWESGFKLKTGKTRAQWVVWNPESGKSLALLTTFALSHQALLTIYSEAGEMQYQEVLPEACEGLGMVDGPTPGSHVLLLGLENKVIQYQKPVS